MFFALPALALILASNAGGAGPEAGGSAPRDLLIWGGGGSPADARRWREGFASITTHLVELDGAFPRELRSDSVPGLKPGFHIVALGLCDGEKVAAPLRALKAVYPGVYVRRVRVSWPSGCPVVSTRLRLLHSASLKGKQSTWVVNQLADDADEWIESRLFQKSGEVQDQRRLATVHGERRGCLGAVVDHKASIEIIDCSSDSESVCCSHPARRSWTFAAEGQLTEANGSPTPAKAAPPAAPPAAPNCDVEATVEGSFTSSSAKEAAVLRICTDEASEVGEGMTIRSQTARLALSRGGNDVATSELGSWQQGWEWGSHWSAVGAIHPRKEGTDVVFLLEEAFQEGEGLGNEWATLHAYSATPRGWDERWSSSANEITATLDRTGSVHVDETRVVDESGKTARKRYRVVIRDGVFETQPSK